MNALGALPLWLLPLAPMIAAALCAVLAITGRMRAAAPFITLIATLISGGITAAHFPAAGAAPASAHYAWLSIPHAVTITLSVHIDAMAWMMLAVVCLVSTLVQIYSTGYMKTEPAYARYFACLSLFTSSMLGLVLADNLFQLYVCWELVGICSYLLIGFWWTKKSAADAAKKAFIVTRFGDVGFFLGVLLMVSAAGSFQFTEVQHAVTAASGGQPLSIPLLSTQAFLIVAPLLLFCGAIGKSAQFPLHVWLPDAMEGPTPVSALIHAATMVAAGVYMVARLLPVFQASVVVQDVIILVGSITALIAATIAMVQTDIKKVMAYSTISQLGYMFIALGCGSRDAGLFHLVTHAMFKALLFLTAGSVIHAMHHAANPNDMSGMGGLGKKMRITSATCLIGALALAGIPPLSGFWSKDAILGAALASPNPMAKVGLIVALIVAALTAFYSIRMWMLTFSGESRSETAAHAQEGPVAMTTPLTILALFSLGIGWFLHSGERFTNYLNGGAEGAPEPVVLWLVAVAIACGVGGALLGWSMYRTPKAVDPITKVPGYTLFANLWFIDAFWGSLAAAGALALGRGIAWFDRKFIDGAMDGIGHACAWIGDRLRRTATGQAQMYTTVVMACLLIIALAMAITQGGGR